MGILMVMLFCMALVILVGNRLLIDGYYWLAGTCYVAGFVTILYLATLVTKAGV